MLTAQQMQEEAIREMIERMEKETEEEKEHHRQLLKGFLKENEKSSSSGTSSPRNGSDSFDPKRPRDIVEKVMAKHGFTREKAIEEIEAFGG